MEHNTPAPVQGTAPLSTTLDISSPTAPEVGKGAAPLTEKPEKPESVGDTLRGELARAREEETKAAKPEDGKEAKDAKVEDDKAKPEKKAEEAKAKPEEGKDTKARAEDGKFAKKVEEPAAKAEEGAAEKPAAERSAPDASQSEGRKHSEPPARFLPEARAKWANVPNEVKAEIHRVEQERETEVAQYRESHENWQKLAKYDEMAKQHKTDIAKALEGYTRVDAALYNDFGKGVAGLAQQYGHQPAQAIAQIIQGFGLTPQQYAEYVSKNPQAAQPMPARQPAPQGQPQQQVSPEIEEIRRELAELKTARLVESTTPVIKAFAQGRSDFDTVWPQMEKVIISGVIDEIYGTGLSPEQKLAEAYRMAGGTVSPSRSDPPAPAVHSMPANDRPVDPAGQKSIRGAPNGGHEPDDDVPETDIKALLRKEMRRAV